MLNTVVNTAAQAFTQATEELKKLEKRHERARRKALENVSRLCVVALEETGDIEEAKMILRSAPWYSKAREAAQQKVCDLYERLLDAAETVESLEMLKEAYTQVFRPAHYTRCPHFDLLHKVFDRNVIRLVDSMLEPASSLSQVYGVWMRVNRYDYGKENCIQSARRMVPKKITQKRFRALCGESKKDSWAARSLHGELFGY